VPDFRTRTPRLKRLSGRQCEVHRNCRKVVGWASKQYGRFKGWRPYAKFADIYLLPHISQWHAILTPFTFPDPKTTVKADVLMTDDTLYSGEVVDYFVDKDGDLSGLFLKNPRQFDRARYLKRRKLHNALDYYVLASDTKREALFDCSQNRKP